MVAFSFGCGVRWSVGWGTRGCAGWPGRTAYALWWTLGGSGAAEAAVGDRARPAPHRDHPRLDELLDAERLEDVEEGAQLVGVAGRLDDDGVGRHVDDLGLEELDRVDDLAAGGRVGAHLDEQDLALHRRVRVELDDLEHLMSLLSCLVTCSSAAASTSTTTVMREMSGSSVGPTASELMLKPRREKSAATRVRTPGLSSTSTDRVCLLMLSPPAPTPAPRGARPGSCRC